MAPVRLPLAGHVLVVVKSSEKVSTREAYAGVRPSEPAVPLAELIRLPVGMWQGRIKNDFEPHVFASHPRLVEVRRSLLDAGALYAAMSGSGAAIFGIFDDAVRAERYLPPFDGVFLHRERM